MNVYAGLMHCFGVSNLLYRMAEWISSSNIWYLIYLLAVHALCVLDSFWSSLKLVLGCVFVSLASTSFISWLRRYVELCYIKFFRWDLPNERKATVIPQRGGEKCFMNALLKWFQPRCTKLVGCIIFLDFWCKSVTDESKNLFKFTGTEFEWRFGEIDCFRKVVVIFTIHSNQKLVGS